MIHRTWRTRSGLARYSCGALVSAVVRTRTVRGAVCGAAAAAFWALEQPLDKLLLASDYDDVELLGRAVVRGDGWYPAGLALHLTNGALFGAVYSNLAPILPLPPITRGPVLALGEQVATWPLSVFSDRFHPARKKLPPLAGNRAAFAQATIRHLLFGVVLGELERRVNATPEPTPPLGESDFSTNGHGSLEHAVSSA